MHETGSGRFCARCGSHVGGLSQCPRCRAPLTRRPATPLPTHLPGTSTGGWELWERSREPEERSWETEKQSREPEERSWETADLRRTPGLHRPSALVGMAAAALALALTWWLVAGRAPTLEAAAGVLPDRAAALSSGAPEEPGDAPVTDPVIDDAASPDESDEAAAEQAGKMNDLLASSSATRADLSDAIDRASRCEKGGLNTIQEVTAGRRDQLATARALDVSALPDGAEVKDALVDALDASFDADAAFLTWARHHVADDCDGPVSEDRDFERGVDRSKDAKKAKARFAKAWRPIAETYDLTLWNPSQI